MINSNRVQVKVEVKFFIAFDISLRNVDLSVSFRSRCKELTWHNLTQVLSVLFFARLFSFVLNSHVELWLLLLR